MQTVRSIRIGVLLRGNLVEEKVFDGKAPITIGQSLRCSLSLPVDGMPAEHVLFAVDQGSFVLKLHRAMSGRVAQKDTAPQILEGQAMVALSRGARGKVSLGDATILFQEIATPARTPRPQLPAAIRGSLFDRVDGRLAALVGGSLLVHGALAVWAWVQDNEDTYLGQPSIAMTYQHDAFELDIPDLVEPTTPTMTEPGEPSTPTLPGVAAQVKPSQNVTPSGNQHIANKLPDAQALRDQAIAMANMLANPTGGPNGTPGGMDPRRPNADLNAQIRDVQNQTVEIGNPTRGPVRDTQHQIGTTKGPIVDAPLVIDGPTKKPDETVPGRIQISPVKTPDVTTLTPAMVLAKIQGAYMSGLTRCYQNGLKQSATLAGKVAISFTVNESGRVVDAHATGVGAGVDGCIANVMGAWTFPVPKEDGDATEASFSVALQLTQ